jgi:HAD superfamily hydrolase (TIGR01509 family)
VDCRYGGRQRHYARDVPIPGQRDGQRRAAARSICAGRNPCALGSYRLKRRWRQQRRYRRARSGRGHNRRRRGLRAVPEPTLTGLAALPPPDALIFDLDGTLVDTVETRIEAWLRVFDDEGIPADRDHIAGLIGADGKKLTREVAGRNGRELTDADQERIDKRSGEIYDELNTNPKPTDGARSLLVALERSQLKWAIATSSRAAQTLASIAALDLPEPPLIVDGSHVVHAKPAPDLLLLAARKLRSEPANCWYVGDSTWDMLAAVAARMVAVGVAYGAADESELTEAGADAVTSLGDLESDLAERGLLRD